jgi:hypothetical protein
VLSSPSIFTQFPRKNQRMDINFEIVKIGWYEIYVDKEIETLYRDFIERIGPELTRNSEEWACTLCGALLVVCSQ